MLAIDDGTAAIVVAAITTVGGILTALLVQLGRQVKQINRAVNNVPEGTPTLVKRVENLEHRQDERDEWLTDCLRIIGAQLGVSLPARSRYRRDDAA